MSARLPVPASIPRPAYAGDMGPERYSGPDVMTPEVTAKMRLAGKVAADAMAAGAALVAPGVSTDEIDKAVHAYLIDHGAYPATLEYRGFPKSCCTSVNEVICHGIPDARPLEDGDIVKIDVTSYLDGVHGDTCATYFVGEVDEASRLLAERTQEAMMRGIRAVKPGRRLNVVGRVIEAYAGRFGYGIVRDYTGHGCHVAFHSGLVVPHYDEPAANTLLEPGLTFTIEPMLTLGDYRSHVWDDGWTVLTNDGSRCAQFEHTIVVTEDGAEILTLP
ncbi:MAG: type I methionyl aminopeptidase [Propionibacteriaceae bacterium]|nr:type I methionyl aminopeptidase [Propionibacteriaceae bacterium]